MPEQHDLKNILSLESIKNIFDTLDEGILIVDRECRIMFYNRTLSHFEGLDASLVVGKTIFEVFPSITPEESTLYRVVMTGKPIKGRFQQYFNYKGKQIKTVNTTIPITDRSEIIGALEVSRDISVILDLSEKVVNLQQGFGCKSTRSKNVGLKYNFDNIIGKNNRIQEIIGILKKASQTTSSILIYGETGTGKELFAQSIHNASPRKNMPFIAQNCATLPESILEGILFGTTRGSFTGAIDKPGLFEQADGGTILLDEINNMGHALQTKLLRVLQEGVVRRLGDVTDIPVDVRIIATTNEKPSKLLESGKLKQDLFFRLSVIYVEIPPLRERREDIYDLVYYFIKKYNEKFNKNVSGIQEDVIDIFQEYTWPGNVRELEHVIEALMNYVDEGQIKREHLRFLSFGAFKNYIEKETPVFTGVQFKKRIFDYEKNLIVEVINSTQGNITKAAQKMGIKRQLLQYYMKKYGIR
ncbi:PAS domain-containing protein [Biomaibacter acetigenes]|uniref:PAS domain-containing protein n=1 Tax=Biomaibacter acetigenes TaxID=2316383 RepID=A0A3G2RA75_9FIRM|nr:sigma 54-interacting transcriptional regulator [Biomaibacter acetigenes]AYO32269.1 PAS domain-containing protein [Biomaibacter acetigenes]RKL63880.1 PAS domain-containing protein [Thermoanaerobacteraceae bacterium SP2]